MVVICVSATYLLSLLLLPSLPSLSVVSASVLQCLFVIYTHTRLTQQFISIPNLFSERENEFRWSVVSLHGCAYQYLYIDLAWPLLRPSSRYRLVFPAGICASNLTDGPSAWGRVYRTRVSHMPLECVSPLSKRHWEEDREGGGCKVALQESVTDTEEWHSIEVCRAALINYLVTFWFIASLKKLLKH